MEKLGKIAERAWHEKILSFSVSSINIDSV